MLKYHVQKTKNEYGKALNITNFGSFWKNIEQYTHVFKRTKSLKPKFLYMKHLDVGLKSFVLRLSSLVLSPFI